MNPFQLNKEFIQELEEAIEAQNNEWIQFQLGELHGEDLSTILYELDILEAKYVCKVLGDELSSDAITYIDPDTRKKFLKVFEPFEIARLLKYIDSDDAADILNEQPISVREDIINQLEDPLDAKHIRELLRYEDDCAGGLMAKELIRARTNWTVKQTIEEIRRQAEMVEKIYTIYVVDQENVLKGRLSLKKMLLVPEETRVSDIYEEDIRSVSTADSAQEVAKMMQRYDLEAIPVVDVKNRLQGRITIDDVLDFITAEAEYGQQMMAGISGDIEHDDNIWKLTKARLPWLLIGLCGGMVGAKFIGQFEGDLAQIPALAFFIPLITATGGNVGIQSATLVVQSLADKSSIHTSWLERLFKTLIVALLNGLTLALVVLTFNLLFQSDIRLAFVVSSALFSVVILSSFMGTLTPLALVRFGINPAAASGPFITTANDLIGLGVYFSVAHLLYANL